MTKIYVIRHGQTDSNKKGIINGHFDDPLAAEGIEQAKMAADFLPKNIKHIYCSSLKRARQTAGILNEKLGIPLTFHDELREVNFGVLNGTPFLDEYKKRHRNQNYDWRPSGESFEDVKERTLKILKEIKAETKNGEALIVAHGGTIRIMHLLESGELLDEIANTALHSFDLDKILK